MIKVRSNRKALTDGLNGWTALRTFLWDLPQMTTFMRDLIERKRKQPGDDILSGLIVAQSDEGERLSEDEIISMTFLLIIAGYETTVHLINNFVLTILQFPDQLEKLQNNPELIDSAVEEVLRGASGPVWVIHGIGTGRLKRGLRDWFQSLAYVERVVDADQGDGGAGCSVVWVR